MTEQIPEPQPPRLLTCRSSMHGHYCDKVRGHSGKHGCFCNTAVWWVGVEDPKDPRPEKYHANYPGVQ